ncbi:hypothetical protein, partial [Cupriavidus numazuensis]
MKKDEKNRLPATSEPNATLSILQLTRLLLSSEIDSAAIGRIVHAAEQIAQSRERIRTEYMIIGSYLADIHQTIYISLNKRLENEAKAKAQSSMLLNEFAARTLQISKHTVVQYLQVYQRFVNSSEAVEFLNLGELTILKRSDISDQEVQLIVDARRRQEPFTREEIIPFIERYRATTEEVNTLLAQLETAKEQLAAGTAKRTELERDIRYLRERNSAADQKEAEHRSALAAAQLALDSQSNTVNSLQFAIQRMNTEKADLERKLSEMSVRPIIKEVEVPSKDPRIALEQAEAERKLASTKSELEQSQRLLNAVKSELLEREGPVHDNRQLENRLSGIKADIDAILEKFRNACSLGDLAQHIPLYISQPSPSRSARSVSAAESTRSSPRQIVLAPGSP